MRKNLTLLFTTLCLLATGSVQAANYDCCEPAECCTDWCGGWSVGADLLYWDVCKNNPAFGVTVDTNTPNVTAAKYHHVDYNWNPGFRVRLGKENFYNCWDLCASYTRLKSTGSNSIEESAGVQIAALNNAIQNAPGVYASISSKYEMEYQEFNVLFGMDCCICGFNFKPFWGIQGMKVDETLNERDQTSVDTEFTTINWNADFKALGLELGALYSYDLECGLGLFTRASLSLLGGSSDSKNVQLQESTGTDILNTFSGSDCYCTPGLHFQVGLNYEKCWCERTFNFHVGYEFKDWWNVPQIRQYPNTPLFATSSSSAANLMMHGLFIGMDVGF